MCKFYRYKLPSELFSDTLDEYTAYCFNEACAVICQRLDKGEQPKFNKTYTSFSDFYKQFK